MAAPQPSPTIPQYLPVGASHCVTSHRPESRSAPQMRGRPAPPQMKPATVHSPQSSIRLQLSLKRPQYWPPACVQLVMQGGSPPLSRGGAQ